MRLFPFQRRIRHPFFPDLAATPAAECRGTANALAGTFRDLAKAAWRGARARRAVYVLTRAERFLSDSERDELWSLFQVPVYVLLVNAEGRIVAWECEVQDGLHRESGRGFSIENSLCACGRPGARLLMPRVPSVYAAD